MCQLKNDIIHNVTPESVRFAIFEWQSYSYTPSKLNRNTVQQKSSWWFLHFRKSAPPYLSLSRPRAFSFYTLESSGYPYHSHSPWPDLARGGTLPMSLRWLHVHALPPTGKHSKNQPCKSLQGLTQATFISTSQGRCTTHTS